MTWIAQALETKMEARRSVPEGRSPREGLALRRHEIESVHRRN